MSITQLVSMIPDWLAVTAGRELAVGFSREDALRRASVLRGLLRDRKLDAARVTLDEDLKAVFHALPALITEVEPAQGLMLAEEANDFYQFLARVDWPNDEFNEKHTILRSLAEAGWRVLGTSQEKVDRARSEEFCYSPPMYSRSAAGVQVEAEGWQELADRGREYCKNRNQKPWRAWKELSQLYDEVFSSTTPRPLFDIRDGLLGDLATANATALRHLGEFESAQQWLRRAESWYQLLPNPERCVARLRLTSLVVEYDLRHHECVLSSPPQLIIELGEIGMCKWEKLGRFLEGATLKALNRDAEALSRFEWVRRNTVEDDELELLGYALVEIGGCKGRGGDLKGALSSYEEALGVPGIRQNPLLEANLALCIGETYQMSGDLETGFRWLKTSLNGYESSGAVARAAYVRLLLADILIAAGLPDVALREVVAALPIIEDKGLVPDGFMAVALLRESVKRRKADPNALRELRVHLKGHR